MNYNDTVEKVLAFLKEKEVCASSRKSHKDCYESLAIFMQHENAEYSDTVCEAWFSAIKKELPRQRCNVWMQYIYQLEEMASTGTISDRRLYLNRSSYDKLPTSWKKDLDTYLNHCRRRYSKRTLEITRVYCSEGLLLLNDLGATEVAEVTYDVIIQLINIKMYCSEETRLMIMSNTSRAFRFFAEKGLCSKNFSLMFNCYLLYQSAGALATLLSINFHSFLKRKSSGLF